MIQDFESAAECVPAGHEVHGTMPDAENMPPGHSGVHEDAPARDEKPAGHFKHALLPAFE